MLHIVVDLYVDHNAALKIHCLPATLKHKCKAQVNKWY